MLQEEAKINQSNYQPAKTKIPTPTNQISKPNRPSPTKHNLKSCKIRPAQEVQRLGNLHQKNRRKFIPEPHLRPEITPEVHPKPRIT